MKIQQFVVGVCVLLSCVVLALFVRVVVQAQSQHANKVVAAPVKVEGVYERGREDEELVVGSEKTGGSEPDMNKTSLCVEGEQEVLSCQLAKEGRRQEETVSVCICPTCERDAAEDGSEPDSVGRGVLVFRGGVAPFAASAGRVSMVWDGDALVGFDLAGGTTKSLRMSAIRWEVEPKDISITSDRGLMSCDSAAVRVDFRGLLDFKEN